MNKYFTGCLAITLLAANGFAADKQTAYRADRIDKTLIAAAQDAQNQYHNVQYKLYTQYYAPMFEAMRPLKKTDTDKMIDALLPTAYMYNELNAKAPEMALEEAVRITVEFSTGWTLRANVLDLFKGPLRNHDNQTLKDFERNLLVNLQGGQTYLRRVHKTDNALPRPLAKAYDDLTAELKNASERPAGLPQNFVEMLKQFDIVRTTSPALAHDIKTQLFVYPQETGWGASVTIREIFVDACLEFWAGGDGVDFKSQEKLAQEYGEETAALLYNNGKYVLSR